MTGGERVDFAAYDGSVAGIQCGRRVASHHEVSGSREPFSGCGVPPGADRCAGGRFAFPFGEAFPDDDFVFARSASRRSGSVSQFGDGHAEKQNGSQDGEVCAPVVGEQCQDTADEESAY